MLTNVSVAFIHKGASFRTEATSQTFLGETVIVYEEEGDWFRVRLEDGYEGWVCKFYIVAKPMGWDDYEFYHHGKRISWIYQSPDRQSRHFRDITLLSKLPALAYADGMVQVLLPDGNQGWIEKLPRPLFNEVQVERLVHTAHRFLGTQYFWGGRSPKGFDCSGFVQTTFWLNGLQLPRDAYQQAEVGVRLSDDYKTWLAGDLIFFTERSERVTHVAISLGGGDFIHSSGYVKLNSLNPDHQDLFLEKYSKTFTKAMRVL
ncbi:MAG: C40 family peptidase [Candidatus Marinimicrobia bacterium]|nr:C40 family peptidase [Candidatus Neomarinimicrobiota bacterium]